MSSIHLHTDYKSTFTSVPDYFIEHVMPFMNGHFVKVYIYLLHCLSSSKNFDLSISHMADVLENTEKDIIRALKNLEKNNLIHIQQNDKNEIVGLTILKQDEINSKDSILSVPEVSPVVLETAAAKETTVPEHPHFTPIQVEKIMEDNELLQLKNIIETMLGTMLSFKHMELIIYLSTELCFSTDLIIYLYESCIERGKTSYRYIETVALGWHKDNITTIKEAEDSVVKFTAKYSRILDAFGLSRMPAKVEKEMIDKWYSYGMDVQVLTEACNRTILNTQKADFNYADKIIQSWHNDGICMLAQVKEADKKYSKKTNTRTQNKKSNSFSSYPQRDYSTKEYSSLEKQLLNK